MTYLDIFVFGWNLNALMFVINILLAFNVIKSKDALQLQDQSEKLNELKVEFDKYYPNRKIETLLSYAVPFTAFLRMSFRLIEMTLFFRKNIGTSMYDFMIYKYLNDINLAKSKRDK